jgi:hypothetical protein
MGIREWLQRQPREPQLVEVQSIEFDDCDELVAAVGEASYQDALRRICGSDRWEDVRCDVRAVLVPEPSNQYDPNAVMVQVDGQLVGYLSRGDAIEYRPTTQLLFEEQHVIVCDARICGRGPGSDTANLGIFLELPTPDHALDEAEDYLAL